MSPDSGIASEESARILVVIEDEPERNLLKRRLQREEFEVEVCQYGKEGLKRVEQDGIDLVLLDTQLARMSGHQMIRKLRQDYPSNQLPVIAVSPLSNPDEMVQALEDGANDVVEKPLNFDLILARIDNQLEIKMTNERIQQLSQRDQKTLLYHRQYLLERLAEELDRVHQYDSDLNFVLIFIEEFWSLHQRHGFKTADEVLKSFASIITEQIRDRDLAGRYGEDKFGVIFPETSPEEMQDLITNLLDALGEQEFRGDQEKIFVPEVTAGGVSVEADYDTVEAIVTKAGQALDEAVSLDEPYRIKSV